MKIEQEMTEQVNVSALYWRSSFLGYSVRQGQSGEKDQIEIL
jgi:hypothetical protein